jgi:NHLM bacteriocin system ABC transporter peptidase/ATP-binding protein
VKGGELLDGGRPDRRRRRRAVRTPTILQIEALECGAAALGIVLAHHGRWVPIEELREACGVSRNGANAGNMLRAARDHGLEAQGVKLEPAALARLDPPVILHWDLDHFVVFEGFVRGGRVRINDPRTGPRVIDPAELDESMTGVALVARPGERFVRAGRAPRLRSLLARRLAGRWPALLFVFLISLALVVPESMVPALARHFVDRILIAGQASWLSAILLALAATTVVLAALTWLQRSYLLRLETRLSVESSSRFLWHLLRLPLEFFHQRYTGDLSSRVALNDRVARLLSRDLAVSALGVLLIVVYGTIMVQLDVPLTVVSVVVVLANVAVLRYVSRRRIDGNRKLLREKGKLTGTGLWGLEMIESLKATASEADLFGRWSGQQAKVVNLRQDLERSYLPLETVPPLLAAIATALILGLGGLRVIEGELSLGSLVAFQALALLFMAPAQRLVNLGSRLQLAEGEMAYLDDVFQAEPAVDLDEDPDVGERGGLLSGRLAIRGVGFAYGRFDPLAVENIHLTLEPGRSVAVVGVTGSGKSTLAKLVAGLYQPSSGEILFDGRPGREIPRSVWSQSVAVVDQDIFVFEGTVRDNLTAWDPTIPLDDLAAAARDAMIYDDIMARPDGFDAPVAEGGINWSGGQLQRLEIARALALRPVLLVLDEATSALDPETEAEIARRIRARGCATLIVAHRLSTIRDADEILVLDGGRVVERGTHLELVRAAGRYADLVIHE